MKLETSLALDQATLQLRFPMGVSVDKVAPPRTCAVRGSTGGGKVDFELAQWDATHPLHTTLTLHGSNEELLTHWMPIVYTWQGIDRSTGASRYGEGRATLSALVEYPMKLSLSSYVQGEPTTLSGVIPKGRTIEKFSFYTRTASGKNRTLLGTATASDAVGGCTGTSPSEERWQLPTILPTDEATMIIEAVGLLQGKEIALGSQVFTLTRKLHIVQPAFEGCVERNQVTLFAEVSPKLNIREARLRPVAPYAQKNSKKGKGIPAVDQHEAGKDLPGKGKVSCAPTAVAASLKWFKDHGYQDIMSKRTTIRSLVKRIETF